MLLKIKLSVHLHVTVMISNKILKTIANITSGTVALDGKYTRPQIELSRFSGLGCYIVLLYSLPVR